MLKMEFQMSALRRCWGRFGLDGDRPHLMVISQWQKSHWTTSAFVAYRWAMSVLMLGMLVASVVMHSRDNPPGSWLIFFTNWGLLLQTAHFCWAAIIATVAWTRGDDELKTVCGQEKGMPASYKASWVMGNIITVIAIGITIGFWGLVYDPKIHQLKVITFITHGLNSVVVIIDFMVSARPCRLAHFTHPVLAFLTYAFFSFCYWLAGGLDPKGRHYIYTTLDWERPAHTFSALVGAVVLLMVLHGLLCALAALRFKLALRRKKHLAGLGNSQEQSYEPTEREPLEGGSMQKIVSDNDIHRMDDKGFTGLGILVVS